MRAVKDLTLREMQMLSARALVVLNATNHNLSRFNKIAHHDSQSWHRAIISWYIAEYGGWPDEVGPGAAIKLVSDQ
jgi:hypothetical protein